MHSEVQASLTHTHICWMQRALYDNFLDALLFIPFLDSRKLNRGSVDSVSVQMQEPETTKASERLR